MSKSFLERRHQSPDYELEVWITGVRQGKTGFIEWSIHIEGETDDDRAALILEQAASVLRDKS